MDDFFVDERDGLVYRTVRIGKQIWFAENFRYKCDESYAYEDNEENVKMYGRLYTWDTAMKIAPKGWHLPSLDEFKELEAFVEQNSTRGASVSLKSVMGWSENYGTDAFGFSALPAGNRIEKNDYAELGDWGNFGASTEGVDGCAYSLEIGFNDEWIGWYEDFGGHYKTTVFFLFV